MGYSKVYDNPYNLLGALAIHNNARLNHILDELASQLVADPLYKHQDMHTYLDRNFFIQSKNGVILGHLFIFKFC